MRAPPTRPCGDGGGLNGLSKPRNVINHKQFYGDDYNQRPGICFTGQGPVPRPELLEQARELGWRAVDTDIR
jgi:hypothetical protein